MLDFKKKDNEANAWKVNKPYTLKEDTINCLEFRFKVHNDIVHGLKYCLILTRLGVTVSKDEEVIGSYAPSKDVHKVQMSPEKTPSGFFARGTYSGKAMLIDLDGICHM